MKDFRPFNLHIFSGGDILVRISGFTIFRITYNFGFNLFYVYPIQMGYTPQDKGHVNRGSSIT